MDFSAYWKRIEKWRLDYLAIFLLTTAYYGYLQRVPFVGDPDGYYHAKIAKYISEGTIITSLPWMQATNFKDFFTDHHLLYHILLAPFVQGFDPLIGVKVATVIFAAAMVTVFYWLLKKLNIRWAFFFALLMITLEGLSFRVALIKANSISLLTIWIFIYALVSKKYWLTFGLCFIFVWLYGGWPLTLAILLAFVVGDAIYRRIHFSKIKLFFNSIIHLFSHKEHEKTNYLRLLLVCCAGLVAGLIINPYWPYNLDFYYQQIIQIGIINQGAKFGVGNEWYGANIMQIVSSLAHVFVLGSLSFLLLFFNHKKVSRNTFFFFLLSFGFLILTLKSRRYIEYFAPFLLLYTASAVSDSIAIITYKRIKKFWKDISTALRVYFMAITALFAIVTIPLVINKVVDLKIPDRWPLDKFSEGAAWLRDNTPENSVVFHSDWDEWPALFYFNDHNYYLIGLDPTFMYNYDPDLHKMYADITTGRLNAHPSNIILEDFGASYVFIDKAGHEKFIRNLSIDPQASVSFENDDSIIFTIERNDSN